MVRFKGILLVIGIVVVIGLLPPTQAVEMAPGDILPFCTASGAQERPDIDGNRVVWEDGRNGRSIYHSSIPGSEGQRITDNSIEQRNPSISGDYIAWQDRRHGNWEIYLFSHSTGERRITNSTTDQQMPVVHGDHIVWYDTRQGDLDICLYTIGTGQETYLSCSPVTEWKPALSDNYVAWEEKTGGGDIWVYNIWTNEKRQITQNSARQTYPAISGNLLAWEDYQNGAPDIYLFDLDNPSGGIQRITSDPAAQVSPAISGNLLAWEDKRDGVWNIYICDLSRGTEVHLPLAPSDQEQIYPAVSGDRIVWQNGRGDRSDIYAFHYVSGIPPVAEFSVEPANGTGTVPLVVSFTDLSSGDPETWEWDFGDGDSLTWQNPMHTYEAPGEYTVSLTVSNRFGSDTITKTALIRAELPTEPPEVLFTGLPQLGSAPLKVLFSGESSNKPTDWFWDFGDGETSTEQNPVHIFKRPGTYNVTLTCSNAAGSATATEYGYITVYDPLKAEFAANVTDGRKPLSVSFTDRSSGDPEVWEWDFGDGGSSHEQNPTHTYQDAGVYTVRLSVANDAAGRDVQEKNGYIRVRAPIPVTPTPVAAGFSANVTSGRAPLSVRFSDTSEGNPDSWSWDFGDEKTSTGQSPVHIFERPGTYTVTLTVSGGSDRSTKSMQIQVLGQQPPPTAGFRATPLNGTAPLKVTFTDTSTGEPSSWLWDFGDNTTSTEQNPIHTYTAAGNYTVTLSARNAAGNDILVRTNCISVHSVTPPPSTKPTPPKKTTGSSSGGGGGGGGRSAPGQETWTIPTNRTASAATPERDEAGRLPLANSGPEEQHSRITSPDGVASLVIAEGVRLVDAAGMPLGAVSVESLDQADLPATSGGDTYVFTGYGCILGPEGVSFSPPVTLAFNFTEEQWDVMSAEGDMFLVRGYSRLADAWTEVPTAVNTETRSVAAEVSDFQIYALFLDLSRGAGQVVASGTEPETGSGHLSEAVIPGVLGLIIVAAGAFLYMRGGGAEP